MMAKKKTSSSSKKKGKIPVEIIGIIYIVLTILGLLRSGFIGKMVSNFGIFLFGSFYNWGLVFFLIVGGYILLFRAKPKLFSKKLIGFYLFAIAILSMSHVKYVMYDTNIGKVVFEETIANVVAGFNDVNYIEGGGMLGAIFSYLFVLAFDVLGSKIVCWALILFGIINKHMCTPKISSEGILFTEGMFLTFDKIEKIEVESSMTGYTKKVKIYFDKGYRVVKTTKEKYQDIRKILMTNCSTSIEEDSICKSEF